MIAASTITTLLHAAVLAARPGVSATVSGDVLAEVQGGIAPNTSGNAPAVDDEEPGLFDDTVPTLRVAITPRIDFNGLLRRAGAIRLSYAPALQVRYPPTSTQGVFYLLHQGDLGYSVRPNRLWLLSMVGSAQGGVVDLTQARILFPSQSDIPIEGRTLIFSARGSLSASVQVRPRHHLSLSPSYSYSWTQSDRGSQPTEPEDPTAPDDPTDPRVRERHLVGLQLSYRYAASRRDEVSAYLVPGYVHYLNEADSVGAPGDGEEETRFVSLAAQVGWGRNPRESLRFGLRGGVFAARTISEDGVLNVFPTGVVEVDGEFTSTATHQASGHVGFGLDGYFDQFRDVAEPRGTLTLGVQVAIPPRWTVSISGAASTAFTRYRPPEELDPDDPDAPDVAQERRSTPESSLSFDVHAVYVINHWAEIEFGPRTSVSASHLGDPDFQAYQFEAWFRVAARVGVGLRRGRLEMGGAVQPNL